MKQHPRVLFAGQICGVEGYAESIATGLMAGRPRGRAVHRRPARPAPASHGLRIAYPLHHSRRSNRNSNPPILLSISCLRWMQKIRDRQERHRQQCQLALSDFEPWLEKAKSTPSLPYTCEACLPHPAAPLTFIETNPTLIPYHTPGRLLVRLTFGKRPPSNLQP